MAVSLQDLKAYNDGVLLNAIKYIYAATYAEFVDAVEAAVWDSMKRIEETASLQQDCGEDLLTVQIVNMLVAQGIQATHDEFVGGHADFVVRRKSEFLWLGEAKIDTDLTWILEGFDQLGTRYSTGSDNQDCGGMIIYSKRPNIALTFSNWKRKLEESVVGIEIEANEKKQFLFHSKHKHSRSGSSFRVSHMIASLYWRPSPKRPRKKGRAKLKPSVSSTLRAMQPRLGA